MALIPGHIGILQLAVLVLYALCLRLSCSTTHDLELMLAQAVVDALQASHLSIKEAAALLGIDEGQFRHQLKCERQHQLSLTKLVTRMPYVFWLHLGPSLMLIVAKKRWAEMAEDFSVRKGA